MLLRCFFERITMKYVKQFGIILAITFIGEALRYLIPLPIPASIYGLIILFIALYSGILKVDKVKEVGFFLIEIMPLMFIPAAVGLLDTWSALQSIWLQVVAVTLISTVIVMVTSGLVTQLVIRKGKGKTDEGNIM